MRRYVLSLAALALLFTVVGQAHASLIDTFVTYEYVIEGFPGFDIPATMMVDPTADFLTILSTLPITTLAVVLDGSTSTITYDVNGGPVDIGPIFGFNGPELRSLIWGDDPAGFIMGFVLCNVSSDLAGQGFGADNVSVGSDKDSIRVNLDDLTIQGESFFQITLLASHSEPIPEPGTLLLIGSGLLWLGVGARRRGRRK